MSRLKKCLGATTTFVFNVFSNFVCDSSIQAFLIGHLFPDVRPRELGTEHKQSAEQEGGGLLCRAYRRQRRWFVFYLVVRHILRKVHRGFSGG